MSWDNSRFNSLASTSQSSTNKIDDRNYSAKINNDNKRKDHFEETTFMRTDSLKSSSILKLTDILSRNILLHPFISLRRTCQVNRKCSPFICVQPFTLISFMYHQQRKQGLCALYKGLSSELLVKALVVGTETAAANHLDWPTDIKSRKKFFEQSFKLLTLRAVSVALTTPFLCSSVIETVQSVIVQKDRPAFIDCLREGMLRLTHLRLTPTSRIMPIWLLIVPAVLYHVTYSAVWHTIKYCVDFFKFESLLPLPSSKSSSTKISRDQRTENSALITDHSRTNCQFESSIAYNDHDDSIVDHNAGIEEDNNQISNTIIVSLLADVVLLPIETVLNSLYIQGTRTIIDNCDKTTVVLPVLTNYEGFTDCYQSILKFEGNWGLYKGLGAIILQYSMHYLLLRSTYYIVKEVHSRMSDSPRVPRRRQRQSQQRPQLQTTYEQNESGLKTGLENNQYTHLYNENRHSTPKFNGDEYSIFGDQLSTPKLYDSRAL